MKKYMKKLRWAMLAVFALSIALAPSLPVSAATFAGGSGAAEDPYLVSTAAQMRLVRDDLDAHYKLVNNIDLSSSNWKPIDDFEGSFDGGGFTISGLKIYDTWEGERIGNTIYPSEEYGLFGSVTGDISNVNLSNVNIQVYVKRAFTGSVSVDVAAIAGTVNGNVTNCTASGTIRVDDDKDMAQAAVAGIVSTQYGGKVTNCHSSVSVTAALDLTDSAASGAGIVAYFNGTEIKDCVNTGNINIGCYSRPEAGGIAGGAGYNAGNIVNCYNMGDVISEREYSGDSYAYGAGILPFSSYNNEIINCGNYGTIEVTGGKTGSCAGGLAGSYPGKIKNSFNSGSVTAYSYGGFNAAGGISATNATVDSCFNSGTVFAGGSNASSLEAGGIVGSSRNPITNVYNAGEISVSSSATSGAMAGGIAGTASHYIKHAYNIGTITGAMSGSIAGRIYQNSSSTTSIEDCYYLNTSTIAVGQNSDSCSVGATSCSSTSLKTKSTFQQFDFTNIWTMGTGDYRYPQLKTTGNSLELKDDFCVLVGHALVSHPEKANTCTDIGWEAYNTCFLCDYTTYEEKLALGHDYSVYKVITEPTCTKVGADAMCCKNCGGYEATAEMSALGHDYSKVTVKKEATCTEAGYKEISCKNCGKHEAVEKVLIDKATYPYPESDHDYGTGLNKTYSFSYPEADNLYLLFSADTYVETKYDSIYIKNLETNEETKYTGTALAGKEIQVPGNSVEIRITSDWSGQYYGFSFDAIYADVAGESVIQTIPALDHDWGARIVDDPGNCTKDGSAHYDCSRCDEIKNEPIIAEGHKWNTEPTVDREATCTRDGEQSVYCSVCRTRDYETIETLPMLGHDWDEGTISKQVSCTEDGNTHYECSRCPEIKDVPIKSEGHKWDTEYTLDIPAGCATVGSKSIRCSVCGEQDKDSIVQIGILGHEWGEGTVTAQPSCTKDGNTHYVCGRCEEPRDVPIKSEGHKWNTEYTIDTPAGCETAGSQSIHCSVCKDKKADTTEAIPALDHEWGEGTVTVQPSCTKDGNTHYDCNRCGEPKDVPIKSEGHKWDTDYTIDTPAGCETEGSQSIHCSVCKDKKADTTEAIPALDHEWGEGTVTVPVSCTGDGNTHYDCSRCGEPKDVPIKSEGHKWKAEYTIDTPAGCETAGSKSIHCSVCEEPNADTIESIPALEHDWSEWTVSKNPGYLFEGEKEQVCGNCADKNTQKIPTLANPFVDVVEGEYYYTPVLWALDHKVTAGLTATTFGPNNPCTRGQIVTFLWRAMGSPEPKTVYSPFSDVPSNQYYYKAVLWAVENGVTAGTSNTTFSPDATCTRGQIVTFLHRTMKSPEPVNGNNPFSDVPSTQYYYKAVLWAVENGITSGLTQTTFGPDSPCTRGQVVTFLYRTLEK